MAYLAGAVEFRDHRFQQIEHRFEQCHIHHLALLAAVPLQQRQGDAQGRVQTGHGVAQGQVGAHRALAGEAVHVAQAANALAHRRIARFVRVGAVLAVAGNARVDQARITLLEAFRAQAPVFQGAGAEVFDQHVAVVDQPRRQLAAGVALQVQRHRALVAAQAAPPERGAGVVQGAPAANRVAAGRLHLDHLGAEIGQQGAGEGARQ